MAYFDRIQRPTEQTVNPGEDKRQSVRRARESRDIERQTKVNLLHKEEARSSQTLVIASAGYEGLENQWFESLQNLPLQDFHLVLYDNTRGRHSELFQNQLVGRFPSYTLLRDEREPLKALRKDDYELSSARITDIYQTISEHLPDNEVTVILEDDVLVSAQSYVRLRSFLKGRVVSAYANVKSRQIQDQEEISLLWDFDSEDNLVFMTEGMGVQEVGGGHTGFAVFKTEYLKRGLNSEPVFTGHDQTLSYRIHKEGKRGKVDWGLTLPHLKVA